MKTPLLIAATCAATSLAFADFISETVTFGPTAAPLGGQLQTLNFAGYSATITDPFDNIDSIQIIVSLSNAGGSFQLDNDTVGAQNDISVDWGGSVELEVAGVPAAPGSLDRLLAFGASSFDVSVSTTFSDIDLAGNDGDDINSFNAGGGDFYDSGVVTGGSNDDTLDVNSLYFAGFAPAFDLSATLSTLFDVPALGGLAQSSAPSSISGSVEIIYEYSLDEIPEPSTYIAGSAALGLAFFAIYRKRKQNKA